MRNRFKAWVVNVEAWVVMVDWVDAISKGILVLVVIAGVIFGVVTAGPGCLEAADVHNQRVKACEEACLPHPGHWDGRQCICDITKTVQPLENP